VGNADAGSGMGTVSDMVVPGGLGGWLPDHASVTTGSTGIVSMLAIGSWCAFSVAHWAATAFNGDRTLIHAVLEHVSDLQYDVDKGLGRAPEVGNADVRAEVRVKHGGGRRGVRFLPRVAGG